MDKSSSTGRKCEHHLSVPELGFSAMPRRGDGECVVRVLSECLLSRSLSRSINQANNHHIMELQNFDAGYFSF
jgi:hypothetical protein